MTDQQTDQPDDRTLLDWVLEASVRVGPNVSRGGNGFRAYVSRHRGGVNYLPGEGRTKREAVVAAWKGLHEQTK